MPDTSHPPRPALVLGAAVWPNGEPSPSLKRRALHAAQLFHEGKVTHIIGCGGLGQHPPTEAEMIGRLCEKDGVPADRIGFEANSHSTADNIRFALPLIRDLGAQSAVIVTDRYHAPRARLTARRLGLTVTSDCPRSTGTRKLRVLKSYLREIPAYLWYWLKP